MRPKESHFEGILVLITKLLIPAFLDLTLNGMQARIIALYLLLAAVPLRSLAQIPPVGQWRDHLPYHQARLLSSGMGKIWCATAYSLFSIDTDDHSVERYSKLNGLTGTGISAIAATAQHELLIVAYQNSQVDILQEGNVYGIDAIKNAPVTGDKTAQHIAIDGDRALLSTGIGIIVLNLPKAEVADTWIIGSNGAKVRVNATCRFGQQFYAATAEGLKQASASGSNLADFRNWQDLSGQSGLPVGAIRDVAAWNGRLVILKNDTLYVASGNNWTALYTTDHAIHHVDIQNNQLLVSEMRNNSGRITVLDAQGNIAQRIQHAQYTQAPQQGLLQDGIYWIADSLHGLSAWNGSNFISYVPNSPYSIAAGTMQVFNNTLWAAAGTVNSLYQGTGNKNGLYQFTADNWTNYQAPAFPALDSFPDIISLAADPLNGSIWAGSFGGGLINIQADHSIRTFKQNSPLQPAYIAPGSYRVSGLAFDASNNLWIANYGANQNLAVKKADGHWQSFFIPYSIPENAVSQIIIDDLDQKWIIAPKGNGLFCFNHGTTIDNPGDDRWKWYRSGQGNGNLPNSDVLCIAKDKNNFIWVGTAQGIGIIQCPQEAFTNTGCDAILPVVQQDNFAGYLFRDEQVQAIAVDGADRKWIGTKNGVWLISADGDKTIYRFTAANSTLVSDNVTHIAIDGQSGEVFFATDKGICSFRSTATEANTTAGNVLVFPNPVPPSYTGTIAIRGVPNNAIVKIAGLDGRLAFQTRALGGQAVWNGKDYTGRTIATGVYLVLVSDDNKQEKLVTKIVFIQK